MNEVPIKYQKRKLKINVEIEYDHMIFGNKYDQEYLDDFVNSVEIRAKHLGSRINVDNFKLDYYRNYYSIIPVIKDELIEEIEVPQYTIQTKDYFPEVIDFRGQLRIAPSIPPKRVIIDSENKVLIEFNPKHFSFGSITDLVMKFMTSLTHKYCVLNHLSWVVDGKSANTAITNKTLYNNQQK